MLVARLALVALVPVGLLLAASAMPGPASTPAVAPSTASLAAASFAPPAPSEMTPLVLADCHYVEINLRIPAANLEALVPADFAPMLTAGSLANLVAGGARCPATMGAQSGEVAFYWADIPVTPLRDDLLAEGVDVYMWRIEHLTLPDLYKQANDAVGATSALMETISVDADPALLGGEFRATAPRFEHHIASPGPGQLGPGFDVRYREFGPATDGGYGFLDATLSWGGDAVRSPGVFTPQEGSATAWAMGGPGAGLVNVGTQFSFPDLYFGHVPP